MQKKLNIFLDKDGVCVNFVMGVLKRFNSEFLLNSWPKGVPEIADVLGISSSEMWQILEKEKCSFWRSLDEYSWFKNLYKEACSLGNVVFLTKPNLDPSSLKGKVEWMQDRFGKDFRKYIITSEKHHCADKNSVLIDDNEDNCESFEKNGGTAILFPQVWNSNHHIDDGYGYTIKKLKEWAA